jgi:hypothetical protein
VSILINKNTTVITQKMTGIVMGLLAFYLLAFLSGFTLTVPVVAQTAVPKYELCTLFPEEYLENCGGKIPSIGAKWMGPKEAQSFASIDTLLPEVLPDMQAA